MILYFVANRVLNYFVLNFILYHFIENLKLKCTCFFSLLVRSISLPISVLQWNVCRLPLRTSSVNHIVVDLPFGKKIGNKKENLILYPAALNETARVCMPFGTGVFLTHHKQAMWKTVQNISWWTLSKTHQVNMGGLNVYIFILRRIKRVYQ